MRPSWDETWMRVAQTIGQRSKCTNRKVGAVVVDINNRPISMGYNGAPANYKSNGSCEEFCPRSIGNRLQLDRGSSYANCVSVHAEANALVFADRSQYRGGTIYVTNPCCWECSKLLANSGLARVVIRQSQEDSHADVDTPISFLESCGLQVEVWEIRKEGNNYVI
jgi:dCMP deaminase